MKRAFIIFVVILLFGCSTLNPILTPTNTLFPINTIQPTNTPIPPTLSNTSEPTITPTNIPTNPPVLPTETLSEPVLSMPSGKPKSEWEGIPVMPNAIAGEGDSKGYAFTIDTSLDEIQKFYKEELTELGWDFLAIGQGPKSVMLIFTRDTGPLSVIIIPQSDGIMYVLLVK